MASDSWAVELTSRASRQLVKIDPETQQRILEHLTMLARDPSGLDIKKLKARDNLWRLRVGRYRVFFHREKQRFLILVVEIVRRSDTTY